jgi:hypothetical protein
VPLEGSRDFALMGGANKVQEGSTQMTNERLAALRGIGEQREYTDAELQEIMEGTEHLPADIKQWCKQEAVRYGFLLRDTGRT